jgi:DNA-binding IclR family transcriptional regulator
MDQRHSATRREKGRAVVRALHVEQLEDAGAERHAALQAAEAHLERIARLLPAALAGGLSLAEIARITGVSRPTLYELRARYSDQPLDLSLGALQAIATNGPLTEPQLRERLRRPPKDVSRTVAEFQRRGFVEYDIDEDEEGKRPIYFLTEKGYELLAHWKLEGAEGPTS